MVTLHVAPSRDTSPDDVRRIHAIAQQIDLPISADEIREAVLASPNAHLITAWDGDRMVACQLMQLDRCMTPFPRNAHSVTYIGLAFKDRGLPGAITHRMTRTWAVRTVGLTSWLFRPSAGIVITPNPRVYDGLARFFPTIYPDPMHPHRPEHTAFAQRYLREMRNLDVELADDLSFTYPLAATADVTEHWERRFKSRFQPINDHFFAAGVLERREGRIWMTGRMIVVLCHRTAFGHLFGRRKLRDAATRRI